MASESEMEVKENLFQDVCFFLADESNNKIKNLLKKGGASREFYISDLATHVIADNKNFSGFEEALETTGLPIVTSDWVLLSAKCGVILPLNPFYLVETQIFSGVVASLSQISGEERSSITAMLTFYGGKSQRKLDQNCTHLISGKPLGAKFDSASKHAETLKVVTPDWIVESIKKKARLGEEAFYPDEETKLSKASSSLVDESKVNSSVLEEAAGVEVKTEKDEAAPPSASNGPVQEVSEEKNEAVSAEKKEHDKEREDDNNNSLNSSLSVKTDETKENLENGQEGDTGVKEMGKTKDGEFTLAGCVFAFSDYQEVIDSASISLWYKVVEKFGGKVEQEYCPAVTHLLCRHQQSHLYKRALDYNKCIATANWLNDILTERTMFPPSCPMHLPVPFKGAIPECKHMIIALTGYEGQERSVIRSMVNTVGAKYTPHLSRLNTHLICKNTNSLKYTKAKEWNIPCINARWLSDIMAAGHVWPCRRKKYTFIGDPSELEINSPFTEKLLGPWEKQKLPSREVSVSQKNKRNHEDHSQQNGISSKVQRMDNQQSVRPAVKVVFTGLVPSMVEQLREMLSSLGGQEGTTQDCTHLIAPEAVRTAKFLSCLSVCQKAVSPKWLTDSHESGKFVDESGYSLVYKGDEETINIEESIRRASQPLLKDIMVFVTPNVQPDPQVMKCIIESAGGTFITSIPSIKKLESLKSQPKPSLAVIACQEDMCMCKQFMRSGFDIYSVEFIISGVIKQELDWGDKYKFLL